jgi:hypothetical protein
MVRRFRLTGERLPKMELEEQLQTRQCRQRRRTPSQIGTSIGPFSGRRFGKRNRPARVNGALRELSAPLRRVRAHNYGSETLREAYRPVRPRTRLRGRKKVPNVRDSTEPNVTVRAEKPRRYKDFEGRPCSQRCGRRDLNPHARKHRNLNPACLPVSPLPRANQV